MLDLGQRSSDDRSRNARVNLAGGRPSIGTHEPVASGSTFPRVNRDPAPTTEAPGGTTLPPTIVAPKPTRQSSAATISQPTGKRSTPNLPTSAASISDPGHGDGAIQRIVAGVGSTLDSSDDHHDAHAGGAETRLHDALLAVLADALDDLERVRIATQNRVRSLQQVKGLEGTKFEANLGDLLDSLAALEHKATLDLQRAMRMHPLGAHVKATKGLGEKQAARLLASIGNPADRPNPAKLWQYAGHGDPLRSRKRKGETVQFSPTAKMRVHLCAESAMKTRCGQCTAAARASLLAESINPTLWQPPHDCTCPTTHPLRAVYDRERLKWADRDTTDGHKHNHALRVVGKRILLDLWKASRA